VFLPKAIKLVAEVFDHFNQLFLVGRAHVLGNVVADLKDAFFRDSVAALFGLFAAGG
jgi:VanZ family protein